MVEHHWHQTRRPYSGQFAYWCDLCDTWRELAEDISDPCPARSAQKEGPIERPELDALIRESIAAYDAMTPEQKKEMHRQQRISWVYGNLALSNPSITREMVEKAAEDWP